MRVEDRHHIRPRLESLAMQEGFACIVIARAVDRRALEVVLDHVAQACTTRGDKARHVPVVRIRLAARAHVRLDVEDAHLAGENPVRQNEVFEESLFAKGCRLLWRRRLFSSWFRAGGRRLRGAAHQQQCYKNDHHRTPGQHRACHIFIFPAG